MCKKLRAVGINDFQSDRFTATGLKQRLIKLKRMFQPVHFAQISSVLKNIIAKK
jgi:hypothetical protein